MYHFLNLKAWVQAKFWGQAKARPYLEM
jgi:hypothetical protein